MSVQLQNISKRFGQVQALKKAGIVFEANRIYGLLGRNGAGKSTLLNILTNRIFPDEGTVLIDGENGLENDLAQSKLFLMSETTLHPNFMRVNEAFRWAGAFYPGFQEDYARKLAEEFALNPRSKISGLSTGYRSIFKLILALSVNVPYLLLDEPVLGLDANHRELFYRRLLEKYVESPLTVVLSTHLIEEVENLVEDVVIIKNGEILCQESRESLLNRGYTVSGGAAAVETYLQDKQVLSVEALGGLRTAYVLGSPEKQGETAKDLEFGPVSLQKLFVQLTNS